VRTWDVFGEQPQLLFSTPHLPLPPTTPDAKRPSSPPPTTSFAVTALDLAWQHGLLLTGHANGEVRAFMRLQLFVYVCVCVCLSVCVYVCVWLNVCVYIYTS